LIVCNLYSMTKNVDAIRRLFGALNSRVGNLPSMPGIFPDYPAPIVRNASDGREIALARWGMPSSQRALMDATKKRAEKLQAKGKPVDFKKLLRIEPDSGTTNIRNVSSAHWKRWLGPQNRCLVPFTSFSEDDTVDGKKVRVWFAWDETRPLLAFAGLWTNWTSVRRAKEGEVTIDVSGFLTTVPNAEVGLVHPKAMPVSCRLRCGALGNRPATPINHRDSLPENFSRPALETCCALPIFFRVAAVRSGCRQGPAT
jgi:putative SOS response-associated peptidase YedK